LYEEHIRTTSENKLKRAETSLAQARIKLLGIFVLQDNTSANHELVIERLQSILDRIIVKRKLLIKKLEDIALKKLYTEHK
jgi:hypothetical protein